MRTALSLAAAAMAFVLTCCTPAEAFDDSLPHYAPYRRHLVHHYATAPRYRYAKRYAVHHRARGHEVYCHRWSWREYCRPYKLGGFFARNPDFRRVPLYR